MYKIAFRLHFTYISDILYVQDSNYAILHVQDSILATFYIYVKDTILYVPVQDSISATLYVKNSNSAILYVQDTILYVQDSILSTLYVQDTISAILLFSTYKQGISIHFIEIPWYKLLQYRQWGHTMMSERRTPQQTCIQRRPNVFDVGPSLYTCHTNVLCLLGPLSHLLGRCEPPRHVTLQRGWY